MAKRAIERKASNTAGYTCFSRACATKEQDERFRGPDYMAEVFLPAFAKGILNIPFLRKLFVKRVAPPGIYEYVLARTKLLDEIFTLAFIRDSGAEGSRVVFDYIYASVLRRENRYYGEKEIFERVSKAGEGWTFGIEAGEIESFLSERGFRVSSHHTPLDLEKAYITADDGAFFGRINGTHCVVTASVS